MTANRATEDRLTTSAGIALATGAGLIMWAVMAYAIFLTVIR